MGVSEKLLTSWCCSVSAVFKRTRGATNPFLLSPFLSCLLCFHTTFDDEKKVGLLLQKVSLLHMVAISMRLHLVKMLLQYFYCKMYPSIVLEITSKSLLFQANRAMFIGHNSHITLVTVETLVTIVTLVSGH